MTSYAQIKARIAKLEKEAEQVLRKEAVKAIDNIKKIMEKYEISLADLSDALSGNGAGKGRRGRKPKAAATKKSKAAGQKLAAKYRNPKTGETWSGRGRSPAWIRNALASGKQDKFLIDSASEPKAAKPKAVKTPRAARSTSPVVKGGRKRRSTVAPAVSEGEASAAAE